MSTLLLRLAAPMQSWGLDKFERRGTETTPTKSGVIGMLAAALGRHRTGCDNMQDLLALRFGIRVERNGRLLKDFHTAKRGDSAYVTYRYYLSDAVFLAGLEGHNSFLDEIAQALQSPVFPLFLGRRSCPPEGKVFLKIAKNKTLLSALTEEPSILSDDISDTSKRRIIIDADSNSNSSYLQRDVPLSFAQTHRKYGFRRVYEVQKDTLGHNLMQDLNEVEASDEVLGTQIEVTDN